MITVSRGLIELARVKEKKGSSRETLLHTERVVSNSPLLSPLVLLPPPPPDQAWSTHSLLGQSLGYPAMPTKIHAKIKPRQCLETTLALSWAEPGARRKPRGHVFEFRQIYTLFWQLSIYYNMDDRY